jgi:outer membrane protein TolC
MAVVLIFQAAGVCSQSFSLSMAESRGRERYPLTRQKLLTDESTQLNLRNLNRNFLPQVTFNAQGSYQSDVTEIKIPNAPFMVEPLSKDQYKVNVDISQTIYDGGINKNQKQLVSLKAAAETGQTDLELIRLKEKIDLTYCNILFADAMIGQMNVVMSDLTLGISKVEAKIKEGTAFRSSLNMLKAEALKTEQKSIEWMANRSAMVQILSILTDTVLTDDVKLEMPAMVASVSMDIKRPELDLIHVQRNISQKQFDMVNAKLKPRAGIFLQGGYGRPALNMLLNAFDWYGIGGIRLSWNFSNLYTASNEKQLAQIDKKNADIREEVFRLNTRAQIAQQQKEIEKMLALIRSDEAIIELRESVKNAASAQLEAGVITAADYIREVNALDLARQSLHSHEVQKVQAMIQLNNITGQTK